MSCSWSFISFSSKGARKSKRRSFDPLVLFRQWPVFVRRNSPRKGRKAADIQVFAVARSTTTWRELIFDPGANFTRPGRCLARLISSASSLVPSETRICFPRKTSLLREIAPSASRQAY